MVIGDTLFVHGGLTKEFLDSRCSALDDMHQAVSAWMSGEHDHIDKKKKKNEPLARVMDADGPMWTRIFSEPDRREPTDSVGPEVCSLLDDTLRSLPVQGVRRMVVGHTPQRAGISEDCGDAWGAAGSVFKVDVGMSAGVFGAEPQVLEILVSGAVRVLTAGESHTLPDRQEL